MMRVMRMKIETFLGFIRILELDMENALKLLRRYVISNTLFGLCTFLFLINCFMYLGFVSIRYIQPFDISK